MPITNVHMAEWESTNRYRRYPFADNCSLTALNGVSFSDTAIIDGFLYPLNLVGELYLSRVDAATGEVVVADSATGEEKGRASLGGTVLEFFDSRYRPIGKLKLGDANSFSTVSGSFVFTPDATRFAPSVVSPQNQSGVQSVITPDGAMLVGDITILGENGIQVETVDLGEGRKTIRIHAVGVASRPAGSQLGDPIKHIYISQPGASTLAISRDGNIIFLNHCLSLADACGGRDYIAQAGGKLPPHADSPFGHDRDEDVCEEPGPPPPATVCPEPLPYGDQEPAHLGFFYLVSLSDNIFLTPSSGGSPTFGLTGAGSSLAPDLGDSGTCSGADRGVDLVLRQLPPRDQQGLVIRTRV